MNITPINNYQSQNYSGKQNNSPSFKAQLGSLEAIRNLMDDHAMTKILEELQKDKNVIEIKGIKALGADVLVTFEPHKTEDREIKHLFRKEIIKGGVSHDCVIVRASIPNSQNTTKEEGLCVFSKGSNFDQRIQTIIGSIKCVVGKIIYTKEGLIAKEKDILDTINS